MREYKRLRRYSPCIKYKIQADPEIDGTNTFFVAESMKFNLSDIILFDNNNQSDNGIFECNLSFSCKCEEKAFYKIVKDWFRRNKYDLLI